ncbi:patatin-like phospholipase family protein [uncultured Winogradskyella sp.]|uniref:patatin-like phospholipase family protein n=1 Tax=uncultured Winogradskyella sp. TaxID=395353 RepID=UPI002795603C|nr:patatin-like phospholipase family protein [uncultured Winogradskyella sp.]
MRIKTKHIIVFGLLVLMFSGLQLRAQEIERPKVGLVLSGGGAKGFAHIGTLKVIDSLGIKVDYIAGTSMGAIIGSLYSSGYSGKQLDSLFKTIDFDMLINDKFSRKSKSLAERNNSERYAVSLPFQKFKISLPSGLSRGQNVYNLLYKMMLPVNDVSNFEDLPIPFFCIATNIETGEPVVMDSGNLAEAVAASGAFPSLFQPVVIDNKIYIDGGVTNNYPIKELRAKGMDIIIGVDVQDDLKDREALNSAPDILLQINNFRTINDMKEKRKLTDIYIKPDITNFSVISFGEGRDIVKNGEAAAKEQLEALKKLKETQKDFTVRKHLSITDSIKIRNTYVSGNKRYTRSYVLGKLKLKGDDDISYNELNRGINNLVATNNFDAFRYKLLPTDTEGVYDLDAKIKESETSTFIKLGVHYDGLYKSAALINISQKRLLSKNDIAALDIVLGDNIRYDFDYFIDKGFYVSIGLKSRYNQFDRRVNANLLLQPDDPLLVNLNKVDVELQDQTNQLYFQTLLAKEFAINLGVEHKRLKITTENLNNNNAEEDFTFENTDYFSLFGNLKIDKYDNRYFPNNGFWFDGNVHWYLTASGFNNDFEPFSIAKAEIGYAFSPLDKLSINLKTSGGFQLGDRSTNFLNFAFGGYGENFINNIDSFYGYDYLSVVGNSFVKADINLDYELFKKHHIMLSGNFANIEDNIFDDDEWISVPDYTGYALGYSIETFLGPIEAKYTISPELKESYWFFNVGFWF